MLNNVEEDSDDGIDGGGGIGLLSARLKRLGQR